MNIYNVHFKARYIKTYFTSYFERYVLSYLHIRLHIFYIIDKVNTLFTLDVTKNPKILYFRTPPTHTSQQIMTYLFFAEKKVILLLWCLPNSIISQRTSLINPQLLTRRCVALFFLFFIRNNAILVMFAF